MSQQSNLIDYARIQALLSLEYVQEHFLAYIDGGDNYDWINVENAQGNDVELYIELEHHRLRIAVENFSGPAVDNGFDDHRHFIFKLRDADSGACELLFQPVEVDEHGQDRLDTFPLEQQSAACQQEGAALFTALEAYLQARDEELQQTKANLPPDLIVNVLGDMDSFAELQAEFEPLAASMGCETFRMDQEFSELEHDDRMPRSYAACMDRTEPSMTERDWQNIEQHRASAYFIVPRIYSERTRISIAMVTARCLAHLIERNLIGAAKIETAGLAHGLQRWKELAEEMNRAVEQREQKTMLLALYKMFVRKPIADDNRLYSCGMQHLGLPDFVIVLPEDEEPTEEQQLQCVARFEQAFLAAFGLVELDEPSKPYPGRPDFGYPLGDIRHNPFGFTQLG
ncbi:hypothetical protein [Aquipseudomonas alcaligenes]|uniref:hypothetical protein n=1 Tax=Aquipseudomonas alcaligenes TaxID=43263 RepID=UPI003748C8EC